MKPVHFWRYNVLCWMTSSTMKCILSFWVDFHPLVVLLKSQLVERFLPPDASGRWTAAEGQRLPLMQNPPEKESILVELIISVKLKCRDVPISNENISEMISLQTTACYNNNRSVSILLSAVFWRLHMRITFIRTTIQTDVGHHWRSP